MTGLGDEALRATELLDGEAVEQVWWPSKAEEVDDGALLFVPETIRRLGLLAGLLLLPSLAACTQLADSGPGVLSFERPTDREWLGSQEAQRPLTVIQSSSGVMCVQFNEYVVVPDGQFEIVDSETIRRGDEVFRNGDLVEFDEFADPDPKEFDGLLWRALQACEAVDAPKSEARLTPIRLPG